MAADSYGPKGEPQFSGAGKPAHAADMTTLGAYAAKVGNRRVGTTAERNAASGSSLWEGLEWFDLDDGSIYMYRGGTWVPWFTRWIDFSATYTGFSGGTIGYSKYRRLGDTARVEFLWTFGSSGAVTNPQLALPIAPASWFTGVKKLGIIQANDATGQRYEGAAIPNGGSARGLIYAGGPPSYQVGITATSPFTWAVNDTIAYSLDYPIDL